MTDVLRDLVLVFLVAGGLLHVFYYLRLPTVVGLLLAGVVVGPHGLGIVEDSQQIDRLAELGVVLLMFSIGLDFTPDRLAELARASGLGAAQMLICIVVTALAAIAFVDGWAKAIFLGFLVAHTSSTLMLKLFLDRGELDSPQVRIGLGISITQDLSSVPMLLALPMMAGGESSGLAAFGFALVKATLVFGIAMASSRWVIPFWMHYVVLSRSRELLLLFLFTICLGMAWFTTALELSVAMGAFLGGLAIAGSEYRHQTLAEVVPFRDLLVSLFFISTGMLFDIGSLPRFALPALAIVPAVLVLKFFSGSLPVLARGYPLRIATLVGLGIAQIGEFSFVVAHAGREVGLIGDLWFQFFVLVAITTMLSSPFLVAVGPRLTGALARVQSLRRFEERSLPLEVSVPAIENHIVIAGYGLNGRNIAQSLKSLGIPHLVLDLNPTAVRAAQQAGENVRYGDCTKTEILRKANIAAAKIYVVAVSDPRATRQTVQAARQESADLHIIARTKYLSEIEPLRRLGADVVISEEFETSLEILARALDAYDMPRQRIDQVLQRLRGDTYEALRGRAAPQLEPALLRSFGPEIEIETLTVSENSPGIGRSLRDLDLRAKTGTTVLAVQRGGQITTIPHADYRLQGQDVVVLVGLPHQVREAEKLLDSPAAPAG